MEVLKNFKLNAILTAVGELIIGIFLVLNPAASKSVISKIVGVLLLIYGILNIFTYLRNHEHFWDHARLVWGIGAVIIALLFLFSPNTIIRFIGSILGICIVLSACSQILRSLTLRAFKDSQWWTALLIGVIFFLLGFSLILFPRIYGNLLIQFIGAFLLIEAVSDLLTIFKIAKLDKIGGNNLFVRY